MSIYDKLTLVNTAFIVLEVCPTCNGAWFDKDELNRLDGSIWTNVEEHAFHAVQGDHEGATCPKCDVPLEPLSPADAADLIVDRCRSCDGFWLDKGELDRITDIADKEDTKLHAKMVHIQRPHDWSWLKWTVYSFKRCWLD